LKRLLIHQEVEQCHECRKINNIHLDFSLVNRQAAYTYCCLTNNFGYLFAKYLMTEWWTER